MCVFLDVYVSIKIYILSWCFPRQCWLNNIMSIVCVFSQENRWSSEALGGV